MGAVMDLIGMTTLDVARTFTEMCEGGKGVWKGRCPVHDDKDPSFFVYPDEHGGQYHCYGCGAHGDGVSLVMAVKHVSFFQAKDFLRAQPDTPHPVKPGVSDDAPASTPQAWPASAEERQTLMRYYMWVAQTCHCALGKALKGRHKLALRIRELIPDNRAHVHWGLGLCTTKTKAWMARTVPREFIAVNEHSGILDCASGLLGGRLTIPLQGAPAAGDPGVAVVGFATRGIDPEDCRPKYLNGRNTAVWLKSQYLYGLSDAKKTIMAGNPAILVEGYTDVIAMHRAGFVTTVAICGTAINGSHLQQLNVLCNKPIIVMMDGDVPGQEAYDRAMALADSLNIPAVGKCLPPEHDPRSALESKKDVGAIMQLYEAGLGGDAEGC